MFSGSPGKEMMSPAKRPPGRSPLSGPPNPRSDSPAQPPQDRNRPATGLRRRRREEGGRSPGVLSNQRLENSFKEKEEEEYVLWTFLRLVAADLSWRCERRSEQVHRWGLCLQMKKWLLWELKCLSLGETVSTRNLRRWKKFGLKL